MQDIFTFLILILLIEDPLVIAFRVTGCKNLTPLKYCPDFDSSKWKDRALCNNCADGTKYHCCKDYDSPKLNCEQGDYYCEKEIYVEGCAEETFCKKGEEPVLNFVKNQIRTDKPEVFCVQCYNNNRYNSFVNKSSATYSECPRKKRNICTPATHKVECGKPSDETSERFCRCDVRNAYYPYSHPDDNPSDGCSYAEYECVNDPPKCKPDQQLLLNYSCTPICKKGFYRQENSDECLPNPTTTYESTRPTENFTDSTTRHSSNDGDLTYEIAIPCGIGGVILIIVIVLITLWRKGCFKQRNEREEPDERRHELPEAPSSAEDEQIQSPGRPAKPVYKLGKHGVPVATPDPSPGFSQKHITKIKQTIIMGNVIKTHKTKGLTINMTSKSGNIITDSESDVDENTSFITRSRSSTSTSKLSRDSKAWLNLPDEELREFLNKVLQLSHGAMLKSLDPVPILDWFIEKGVFTEIIVRDIREEKITSDRIRELLKRIKEKGIDCYVQFKESLSKSKQDSCLRELKKQESHVYKTVIDNKSKNPAYLESGSSEEESTERDEYTAPSKHHRLSDDEQNEDGSCDQYTEKIYSLQDDQFAAEAGDVQQQEMEDQAEKYLHRLNDAAGDFSTFVEEVDLVKKDIDKRLPQLLICSNETVTKLECAEEEKSPEGFQAYKSSGINNSCLYQSVSMLLRGDEQLQHRLRLKTTLHCCKAFARYIKVLETHFQHELIDTVKQFFYNYTSGETWRRISGMTEKENIIKKGLKALIKETACIGTDSSRLHVQFLSDTLGMKIEEHFQLKHHFGDSETVIPLGQIEDALGKESLHVYWIDMSGKGKKMNHIVPLLRNS